LIKFKIFKKSSKNSWFATFYGFIASIADIIFFFLLPMLFLSSFVA